MYRFLAVALAVPLLGGCVAMQRDVRDLQTQLGEMQAAQERLLREIQRQNGVIVDSLRVQDVRLRGDFNNQLVRLERQIVQIQEQTGLGQQQLAELRDRLEAREEELRRAEAALQVPDAGDPVELYSTADAALQRRSMSTALAGFEEFVRSFPDHARAPEARLHIADLQFEADRSEEALAEYSRIVELHPNSPQAASALFRAALIVREDGDTARARSMLNQLTAAYPGSPEAADARDELRRMR